jgi:hypothetical protein
MVLSSKEALMTSNILGLLKSDKFVEKHADSGRSELTQHKSSDTDIYLLDNCYNSPALTDF